MNRTLDRRLFPLILISLVLLGIPISICQNDVDQHRTCSKNFHCGRLSWIGYPFYGGNRPVSCGYPGFELNCQPDSDPLLNISSIIYRVLVINPSARTLQISRIDLLNNFCPTPLSNTALNFTLFDFYPPANDQNITLYYGCTFSQQWPSFLVSTYLMNCSGNSLNFFATSEVSDQLNNFGNPCNNHIYVPVNQNSALDLGNPAVASMDRLRSALESGFTIEYVADNQKCDECTRSGGLCGYNENSTSFACYSGDGNGTYDRFVPSVLLPVSLSSPGKIHSPKII